jgi:hypothetical protein
MDRHDKNLLLFNIAMQFVIFLIFVFINKDLQNQKGANIMEILCGVDVLIFTVLAIFIKPKK